MRTREFLSAFMITFLLFGCSHKHSERPETNISLMKWTASAASQAPSDPLHSELEEIKKKYRAEFEEMYFPRPGKRPALGAAAVRCKGFPKTLEAIRAFDRKYGTNTPEYAHLIVLKGMIYLQSGQYQFASAMEPEVIKTAVPLSRSEVSKGDELLARNFSPLVSGWREIYKHQENIKALNAGKPFPFASADLNKVHQSADRIGDDLRSYSLEHPEIARDPETNLNGLYIAVLAATFYTWVQENNDRHCAFRGSDDCTPKRRLNKENAVFYKKGRDLIGLFLTEGEKNSVLQGQIMKASMSPSRQRYLGWYGWLSQRVREASGHGHRKSVANHR